nr:class I SAM-dependent methyltransferase [Synechococcus sp. UW140]
MSLFEQQWQTYRTVLEHDSMEHRAIADATASVLRSWFEQGGEQARSAVLVDLGCGDLAHLAPLFRSLPLRSYTGLDLAASVLLLAERQMGQVRFPCHWIRGDLLDWAKEQVDGPVDLIHSAFAIHHLSDSDKVRFLEGARRRIADDGLLVWTDVFQEEHESRARYLERYVSRVQHWPGLSSRQRDAVVEHMYQCDWPARRGWIESVASDSGWMLTWSWLGQHQAEALALLRPLPSATSNGLNHVSINELGRLPLRKDDLTF